MDTLSSEVIFIYQDYDGADFYIEIFLIRLRLATSFPILNIKNLIKPTRN